MRIFLKSSFPLRLYLKSKPKENVFLFVPLRKLLFLLKCLIVVVISTYMRPFPICLLDSRGHYFPLTKSFYLKTYFKDYCFFFECLPTVFPPPSI